MERWTTVWGSERSAYRDTSVNTITRHSAMAMPNKSNQCFDSCWQT